MNIDELVEQLTFGRDVPGISVQDVYGRMAEDETRVSEVFEEIHKGGDWCQVVGYFEECARELIEERAAIAEEEAELREAGL